MNIYIYIYVSSLLSFKEDFFFFFYIRSSLTQLQLSLFRRMCLTDVQQWALRLCIEHTASISCLLMHGFPSNVFSNHPRCHLGHFSVCCSPRGASLNQINRNRLYHLPGPLSGQLVLIAPFCLVRYMPKPGCNPLKNT